MKKIITVIAALVCFTVLDLSAQNDTRDPGIYAVVDGVSTPLVYTSGIAHKSGTEVLGLEIGRSKFSYRGATSGVESGDTFVLVIDPEKKNIIRTLKKYEPFVKSMTPSNIIIVPLIVKKDKRIYDEGMEVYGFKVEGKPRVPFSWEMISDNSFQIVAEGLAPGEYGIIFRATKLAPYDYDAIFGFTVPGEPAAIDYEGE